MAKKMPKATASTQAHLDIEDILDNMVILKTGWVALVMSTTAVNFDLLSEAEQDATIYAFGALLNSLSFPMQILIRSNKADITSYFQHLEEAERAQPNPDLKRQIQKYKDFIELTVQRKTVLDKKFYLIITFSPLEAGLKGFGKNPSKEKEKNAILSQAKAALAPRRDHVIKQIARLGLTAKQLTTQELIELFYDIYNPAPTGTQRVLLDTGSYTTPLVEPALEVPTPAPPKPNIDVSSHKIENLVNQQVQPPQAPQQNIRPVQSSAQKPPASTSSVEPQIQNPPPPPPQSEPQISRSQSEALKSLQQATSSASEFLNKPQFNPNLNQQPQNTQVSFNPVQPNPNQGENNQ